MQSKIGELLQKPIVVINIGLVKFAESLKAQNVELVQVDWVPPAGGDREMIDLLTGSTVVEIPRLFVSQSPSQSY